MESSRAIEWEKQWDRGGMENNFIEMSNAIQENQQSSTVLSSTWTLGTQNSNEKSISNSRILFYCMTPLKKKQLQTIVPFILFFFFIFLCVGTSFRHSACSRYNFKCDFIGKEQSWIKKKEKSCVCVLLKGTRKMKTERNK